MPKAPSAGPQTRSPDDSMEVEAAMRAEGRQVDEASPEELDRQWLAVKSREGLERAGDGS